ncbi:MAG: ATP-dependent sacrificial sulfur transferase LarE [Terrimicrobiaceae bacterium]|nr:ATP-dependent sacrificial sulfur transferase LarE [Terrimicrobiaceae bacterium]
MTLEEKIRKVEAIVRSRSPLVVAYSGGVDSTCLLALASRAAGGQVLAAIADSPSLPRSALRQALEVAGQIGTRVEVVATAEFENEDYLANPPNRCYFCKVELFSRLEKIARDRGYRTIAYGENADDRDDLRPGSRAAAEFQILAPLKAAGLSKAEVREISRTLGLPTHDAPAQPCLSSRIPHGTRVTSDALSLVERGEEFVRSLGFKIFRVRFLEEPPITAKLQIAPGERNLLAGRTAAIEAGLKDAGFASVVIDPDGYRSA